MDGGGDSGANGDGVSPAASTSSGVVGCADDGLLDSEVVVRRLGGWQVMGSLADPHLATDDDVTRSAPAAASPPASLWPAALSASGGRPLRWTATAAAECERLHAIVAAVGEDAATRFAAALMRLMVRLMVDGIDAAEGDTVEIALLPVLAVRIHVARDAIVVLGLSPREPIS